LLSLLASQPTLSSWQVLLRLAIAAGLGAALGLERELRDHEAGLRTHLLVCLGSAIFTVVGAYGFADFVVGGTTRADPTRIAAQIVTGIGFLGAGAIIRDGMNVRGLTTAANLWVVAAIGIACGAGYYSGALIGTAIALVALWPLRVAANQTVDRLRQPGSQIVLDVRPESVDAVLDELSRRSIDIDHVAIAREGAARRLTFRMSRATPRLAASLGELDGVTQATWGA